MPFLKIFYLFSEWKLGLYKLNKTLIMKIISIERMYEFLYLEELLNMFIFLMGMVK